MKTVSAFLMLIMLTLQLVSCGSAPDPVDMLRDFTEAYSAEGIIYYSEAREGEIGYLDPETGGILFRELEQMPDCYAILLNSRSDYGSECGVFVSRGSLELEEISEMCERRMKLLRGGERSLLIRSESTVFYSTLPNPERVEKLWRDILRSHI